MNDLIHKATVCIAHLLSAKLPDLSPDWWQKLVLDRLSFHQQRMAKERGFKTLQQLDFAAILRVLDQNWYELSDRLGLPGEARSWVKEMQTVRNKWAHLSAELMPASETYRDADTLGRLLATMGADAETMAAIESTKAAAIGAMTKLRRSSADEHKGPPPSGTEATSKGTGSPPQVSPGE